MKIRIHKDITVRWRVTTAGEAVPLTGRDLAVVITDPTGRKKSVGFAITDNNLITFIFAGKDQTQLGKHTASLLENAGKDGSSALDAVDFVQLVRYTSMEDFTSDNDNLEVASIDLEGNLSASLRGASAYEVWLTQGHTGSEADFLEWLKGPKGDKGYKGEQGPVGPQGPQGPAGSDASVTSQNIQSALGYAPAKAADLTALSSKIGELSNLETEAKNNLVAAINEAAQKGGSDLNLVNGEGEGSVRQKTTLPEDMQASASGMAAFAEGGATKAEGLASHAEGAGCVAGGDGSHAEGGYTQTTNEYEHAEGYLNESHEGTIHSVGMGGSNAEYDPDEDFEYNHYRLNAHEIMKNGDHYIFGIGGYRGDNPDEAKTLQEVINDPHVTIDLGDWQVTEQYTTIPDGVFPEGYVPKIGDVLIYNITGGGQHVSINYVRTRSTNYGDFTTEFGYVSANAQIVDAPVPNLQILRTNYTDGHYFGKCFRPALVSYVDTEVAKRYAKPADGIPESDLSQSVQQTLAKVEEIYQDYIDAQNLI